MIGVLAARVRSGMRLLRFRLLHYWGGITIVQNRIPLLGNPAPVLKAFGAQIGEGTIIYPGLVIHAATKDFSNLRVGRNCRILRGSFLDLTDTITLEDNSSVGIRNSLITHVNAAGSPLAQEAIHSARAPIVFKHGAVSYTGATILMGVTLHECSVVGAGSLVSRSVPAYTLVMGNPARRVKAIAAAPPADTF